METNFQINEIKEKSIHDDLFTAMCLMKKARNIIHSSKGSEELGEDLCLELDAIQTTLNDDTAKIKDIIGHVMYCRADDLV